MVSSGAGLRYAMLSRIAIAWLVTLPVAMPVAGSFYYLLETPFFVSSALIGRFDACAEIHSSIEDALI
jgi:hypothetical protein